MNKLTVKTVGTFLTIGGCIGAGIVTEGLSHILSGDSHFNYSALITGCVIGSIPGLVMVGYGFDHHYD